MTDDIAAELARQLVRNVELRIVANRLHSALYSLVHGPDSSDTEAAWKLLEELPRCIHCGQMEVGHDACHGFTAK